jgi:hypothetical protein
MAIKAPSSSKPALYKMVSLPSYGTATATKGSGESKTIQSGFGSFITSINRMGATVNSTIIVNQQILKTLTNDANLKSEELAKMKSALQKEKAGKDIDGTDEGAKKEPWWKKAMSGFAKAVVPNFFEGLAQLGQFFLRTFVLQSVLRWMSDPKNGEKLSKIVGGLIKIFSWLYKFVTENLFKTIEGLVDMFDGDKNIWERIVGFGKFITGFGALLLGMAFLKRPGMVIKGFTWVLTTLYKNLFKSKAKLAKQSAAGGIPTRGGGRGRGLATFAAGAATGALVSGMLSGGGDSSPDPSDGSAPNEPMLAAGGIATKPTSAILGERGPEITMPLSRNMPIPSDNDKRRKNAGIKPLSSLGSAGASSDPKQANNLAKLFMAPFKGIGAGILANISQVVSSIGGPIGRLITPILGNVLAPIANSFGIPPGIVKTIQGKMSSSTSAGALPGKKQGSEDIKKLFGKAGSVPSEEEKKFKKRNDNSVLGLLSDILGASIVINNKLKKGGDSSASSGSDASSGAAGDSPATETSAGSSGGGAAGGPTNTAQDTIKKAGGMGEDGSLQGVKGTTKDKGRAGKEHSPGAGLMPVEGGDRKYWYNNSGDVFGWQKPGDPLTDITSSQDKQMLQGLGGPLVRDLKDGKVKILKGMFGGDQTPVGHFSYDMGAILKKRGESGQGRSKTGATKDQWEKPKDGKYGPTITPKRAAGGWISGPMSGYPVSLDGGNSIAFEGHGTEWVGFKKAAGGRTNDAFVVPFNTPATRSNGGLVNRRLSEAKNGGYSLPKFSAGGVVKTEGNWDTGPGYTVGGGTDQQGRPVVFSAAAAKAFAQMMSASGGKVKPSDVASSKRSPEKNRAVGGASGSKHMYGTAMDIHGSSNSWIRKYGSKYGWVANDYPGSHGGHFEFKGAGITPADSPSAPGKNEDGTSPDVAGDTGSEAEKSPKEQLDAIIKKISSDIARLNGIPTDDVGKATEAAKSEKDKADQAATQRINNAGAAAMKNAKTAKPVDVKKAFAAQPIILPGPKTSLPIEALNPSTSMIQYGWKVNL